MPSAIYRDDQRPNDHFADPLDAILAEIALNIQLPPGLHEKAVDRYKAVCRYIDRPGSPLEGRVSCLYPQGSMAIDATTSTRGTDDEYDIDAVAEVIGGDETPKGLLDLLERALAGYPVSRIERKTRCITLYYADGMHLDVTPARRVAAKEKQSVIPHAKQGEDASQHRYVPMNAYGFCAWYNDRTPIERRFALALNKRLYEDAGMAFAAAEVEDVPEQTPLLIKSVTTVALQLLKRHRNIAYADAKGRVPPSILLSCHAGHAASPGMGLADMVMRQARWTARAIDKAAGSGRLLDVYNPEFPAERFTDRWPENQRQQSDFAALLHALADGLEAARKRGAQLEDLQAWLREQFGAGAVTKSIAAFNARLGRQVQAREHGYTRSGGLFTPAAPALVGLSTLAPVAARAHTNMGGAPPAMILSIDAQIARMRAVWPEFALAGRDGPVARWRGPLRPLLQTYVIDILYRAPMLIERLDAALHQPRVSVVSPRLRRRPGDSEGALPHVYYGKDDTVRLCLLDPEAGDWSPADCLAETTVPWTIEWLAAYEGWRATGKWTASGRHVEPVAAHG